MNGTITRIRGATVRVAMQGLRLHDRVFVGRQRLTGEVVQLERRGAVVQVFENTRGLGIDEPVASCGAPLQVVLGPGLLGSIFDGLQRPLTGLLAEQGPFLQPGGNAPPLDPQRRWSLTPVSQSGAFLDEGGCYGEVPEGGLTHRLLAPRSGRLTASLSSDEIAAPAPLAHFDDGEELTLHQLWPVRKPRPCRRRLPLTRPLITGQRCIDFLFPLMKGGVAIIPGGFGTGKTVLEQSIAKFADADVVVYVGCGERGNEMASLLDEFSQLTGKDGRPLLERTIVIANTSNMPVAAREASIFTAVTMAEYYRDMGYDVLFLADSLSRWAEALREIASSLEEMPGEEGYPTSLSSRLAAFMERAGEVETCSGRIGSLTMLLAVSPPGGDFSEPVTQACLRVASAFYMLDTSLAHARHFPAIHWGESYSLYGARGAEQFAQMVDPLCQELQRRCRELLQQEEALREVAEVVGMEGLQPRDRKLMRIAEQIRRDFLCQNSYDDKDAYATPEQTFTRIAAILADAENEEGEKGESDASG